MRERRQAVREIDCTAESIAQPDRSSAVTQREAAAEPSSISRETLLPIPDKL